MNLIEKLEKETSEARDTLADISKYQHYKDLEVMQGGKIAGLEIAIEIVKQHQAESWVSVGERLPSENTTVLVYKQKFNLIGIAEYIGNNFWKFITPSRDPMNTYMGSVSHWQPLPQPPSEVLDD